MAGQCPYLGLDGDRRQTLATASPRHRCFARGQAERIGAKHQAMTCLTAAFRRCPRMLAGARVEEQPLPGSPVLDQDAGEGPPPGEDQSLPLGASPPAMPGRAHPVQMERATLTRPAVPFTEVRTVHRPEAARRRWTAVEMAALGLAGAIVLAVAFIAYAAVYRLGPGLGLAGPLPVAQAVDSSELELLATLVPTYTPTPVPEPTLVAPTQVVEPPTPLPEPTLAVPTPPSRPIAESPPTRLVIDKINLDIPVLPVGVKTAEENGRSRAIWDDVPNAGGFHETSALPGHPGNTVINGHRDIQGSVFRHLDRVEVGDEIVLYVGDVAYPYRVTETLVVPEIFASAKQRAENLRLIGTMPEERLTLVTCTPVGLATHRLLVVARPPEQAGPDMPEAGSDPIP